MADHYRVVLVRNKGTEDERRYIQREHFDTFASASQYIEIQRNKGVIFALEDVEIIPDFDFRVYPIWRANRPKQEDITDGT